MPAPRGIGDLLSRFEQQLETHKSGAYHETRLSQLYSLTEDDLRDITGTLATSGDEIDRGYIGLWAEGLNLSEICNAILARQNAR